MSNEQKKYKSCPDCIDRGKTPSGETRDGIYLECSTCDGTGQVEHPQEGKPLTAEEIREKACAASAQDKRLFYTDVKSYMLGFYAGYDHVANQTAALREELVAVKKELQGMKDDYHDIDEDGNHIGYGYWKDEYFRMQESARKYLKQRDEVTRQRDELQEKLNELMNDKKDIHKTEK